MFVLMRPSPRTIERFLRESQDLPLSYSSPGILGKRTGRRIDEVREVIGRGQADFEAARQALASWKQFDIGWVSSFPRNAPVAVNTVVAVLIRHLGFWSLNGCRVVYHTPPSDGRDSFGYAYGTLPNHAEGGEELFEIERDARTEEVTYRIVATSWPQAMLAVAGQPIVRILQARFRRDSAAAMARAVRSARGLHG